MPALEQGVVLTEREVWEDCAGVRQGPSNHRAKHAPLRTTHDPSNPQICFLPGAPLASTGYASSGPVVSMARMQYVEPMLPST